MHPLTFKFGTAEGDFGNPNQCNIDKEKIEHQKGPAATPAAPGKKLCQIPLHKIVFPFE